MPSVPPPSRPDPLLESLRRRHLDVDVVVLPPVRPAAPRADPRTPEEEVLTAVEAARAARDEVTGEPSGAPADAGGAGSASWEVAGEGWCHDPETGTDVLVSRDYLLTDEEDRVPALRRLGNRLLAAGWAAGPTRGRRPALEAFRNGVRARAWVTEGGLGLAVSSRPVRPGATLRRRIVASR